MKNIFDSLDKLQKAARELPPETSLFLADDPLQKNGWVSEWARYAECKTASCRNAWSVFLVNGNYNERYSLLKFE